MTEPAQETRIQLFIQDPNGRSCEARVAANVPMRDLIQPMVTAFGLPAINADSFPLIYKAVYKDLKLQDNDTLNKVGVEDADTINLKSVLAPIPDEIADIIPKLNLALRESDEEHRQPILGIIERVSRNASHMWDVEARLRTVENDSRAFTIESSKHYDLMYANSYKRMTFNRSSLQLSNIEIKNSTHLFSTVQKLNALDFDDRQDRLLDHIVAYLQIQSERLSHLEQRLQIVEEAIFGSQPYIFPTPDRRARIQLRLDRPFESFSQEDLELLIGLISARNGVGRADIRVVNVERGSVLITLDVPAAIVQRLLAEALPGIARLTVVEIPLPELLPQSLPGPLVESAALEIINPATLSIKCDRSLNMSFQIHGVHVYESDDSTKIDIDVEVETREARRIGNDPKYTRESAKRQGETLYKKLFAPQDELMSQFGGLRALVSDPEHLTLSFVGPSDHLELPYEFLNDGNQQFVIQFPICRRVLGVKRNHAKDFGRLLAELKNKKDPLRVLLVASDKEQSEQEQIEADQEVRLVEGCLNTKANSLGLHIDIHALLSDVATDEIVKRHLERCQYHIVHYVGECEIDESNGENSCLRLREQRIPNRRRTALTARELGVHLSESQVVLFFLSANSTAFGSQRRQLTQGADYLGLMDALVRAGVPNVLGYRWKLSADCRSRFAEQFYRSLLETASIPRAAYRARQAAYTTDANKMSWLSSIVIAQ